MTTERALWIIFGVLALAVIVAFDVHGIMRCATSLCFWGISFNKPW